jgi:hypothetical protein
MGIELGTKKKGRGEDATIYTILRVYEWRWGGEKNQIELFRKKEKIPEDRS